MNAAPTGTDVPADFMDRVWQRVARLSARADRRRRLSLVVGMCTLALGTGFVTVEGAAYADQPDYVLLDGAELSPSSLLN